MAESASALIMPPCTKPETLAMSSVGVMVTVAQPSPLSIISRPSHAHARLGAVLLTPLTLGNGHAGRRRTRHEAALLVEHVGFAEEQRLLDLHHTAHRAHTPFLDRPEEVDLQLDGRVPHAI